MLPDQDTQLVQIVDAALADASNRALKADGSSWLACRPGCTPCCHGMFRISMLDAERLRSALRRLSASEPARATNIKKRADEFVSTFTSAFPGNPASGVLSEDEDACDAFMDLPGTDVPCPVLSPTDGRCELYEGRPLTCRIFGPPVLGKDGIGVCELCYVGADAATVIAGQMHLTHEVLEKDLLQGVSQGETVVAWAIASEIIGST